MYDVLVAWPPPRVFQEGPAEALPLFLSRVTFTSYRWNRLTCQPQSRNAQWRATGSPRASRLTHGEVSVNEAEGKIDSTSAAGLLGHTVDPMVLRCTAHDQDAARSHWKLRHLAC